MKTERKKIKTKGYRINQEERKTNKEEKNELEERNKMILLLFG